MGVLLSVAAGGAIGSVLRYLTFEWAQRVLPVTFPFGTLTVNVVGSLAVGFVTGMVAARGQSRDQLVPLFLIVGVCGGFTTFSAFSADTSQLIQRGAFGAAALNAVVQVAGGLAAVFAGFWLSRQV
jgi:CrcB protein